jgi:hypothetical protein
MTTVKGEEEEEDREETLQLIIPKLKTEGGQDRRKPAVPRTNHTCLG